MGTKLRFKPSQNSTSQLKIYTVVNNGFKLEDALDNFQFASAVVSFGMILRDSQYKGKTNFDEVLLLASQSQGNDLDGERAEFIPLAEKARL